VDVERGGGSRGVVDVKLLYIGLRQSRGGVKRNVARGRSSLA